jgi:membrane protein DedA with SNARE-associated domain
VEITELLGGLGLASVFVVVLIQSLGAPIPASPLLMLAGAQAIDDPLHGMYALVLTVGASGIGSVPWFYAGRRFGYRILKLVCRLTLSADSCVRQTEKMFERYGVASLVFAKFIPGLARVAAPLAGALRIRVVPFLLLSGAGAALWAGGGLDPGLYVAIKLLDRLRFLRTVRSARIAPAELHAMIGRGDDPVILDVRSEANRRLDPRTVPGARPVDPDRIEQNLVALARDREVIVYCACPNDATAMRVALLLRKRGIRRVRSLAGGIDAWAEAIARTARA